MMVKGDRKIVAMHIVGLEVQGFTGIGQNAPGETSLVRWGHSLMFEDIKKKKLMRSQWEIYLKSRKN